VDDCLLRERYLHLKRKVHAELADGGERVLRPDGHLRAEKHP
jgi:hypothetical protein